MDMNWILKIQTDAYLSVKRVNKEIQAEYAEKLKVDKINVLLVKNLILSLKPANPVVTINVHLVNNLIQLPKLANLVAIKDNVLLVNN